MTSETDDSTFRHEPVMVAEVVDLFHEVPTGTFVDATVGGGGHAAAVLADRADLRLVGIDRDPVALRAAATALAPFGDRVTLVHERFDQLGDVLDRRAAESLIGVLFDLGVSSPQLDRESRGFSYRNDGPLDMRMDPESGRTADDVVNGYDLDRLSDVLRDYGDERFARRIARTIVEARPVESTTELARLVVAAIPAAARRRGGHPATRTFQAIRIEVNEELTILPTALDRALEALAPAGRCAVLAYHSGEDRIVKDRFEAAVTGGCTCPPKLPCACGARPTARWVRKRAQRPGSPEIEANPRASSARLRAVERLGSTETGTGPAKVVVG